MFRKRQPIFSPEDGLRNEQQWEIDTHDLTEEVIYRYKGDLELRVASFLGGLVVVPAFTERVDDADLRQCQEMTLQHIARSRFWYIESGVVVQPIGSDGNTENLTNSSDSFARLAEELGLKINITVEQRTIPVIGTIFHRPGTADEHRFSSAEWAYETVRYAGFSSVIAVVDNTTWSILSGRNRANNMPKIAEYGATSQGVLLLSDLEVEGDILVPKYSFFGNGHS